MIYEAAVITISDRASRGVYADESGKRLQTLLTEQNFRVKSYEVIPDDCEMIKERLIALSDEGIHLVLTSGGTGFSQRDVTPEATQAVIEKQTPGICEAMRAEGAKKTPMAYLSRGVSGIRKKSLLINFPGSPKACEENFAAILPFLRHGLEILIGCNHSGHTK